MDGDDGGEEEFAEIAGKARLLCLYRNYYDYSLLTSIVIYLFGENNRQVMYRQDTRQKYIHDIDSID